MLPKTNQIFHNSIAVFSLFCFVCSLSGFVSSPLQQIITWALPTSNIDPMSPAALAQNNSYNLFVYLAKGLLAIETSTVLTSKIIGAITYLFASLSFLFLAHSLTRNIYLAYFMGILLPALNLSFPPVSYGLHFHSGITMAEFAPVLPVLIISLFAMRLWKIGFTVLGFSLLLHLTNGFFSIGCTIILLILSGEVRKALKKYWLYILPGLIVLFGVLIYKKAIANVDLRIPYEDYKEYIKLFSQPLCHHYMTFENIREWHSDYNLIKLTLFLSMLCLVWYLFTKTLKTRESKHAAICFLALMLSSILSAVVLGILSLYPDSWLGSVALRFMPFRFVTAITACCGAALLCMVYNIGSARTFTFNICICLILLLIDLIFRYDNLVPFYLWSLLIYCFVKLIDIEKLRIRLDFDRLFPNWKMKNIYSVSLTSAFKINSYIFSGLMIATVCSCFTYLHNIKYMENWQNNSFWYQVHLTGSPILTSTGINNFQIRSGRRGVLWHEEIGGLPYVPQSGFFVKQALQDLYSVDLHRLPKYKSCSLPNDIEKETWEKRTSAEWFRLARKYNFKAVVAPTRWKLKLGEKGFRSQGLQDLTLYTILPMR